jgi:hypothetical protein
MAVTGAVARPAERLAVVTYSGRGARCWPAAVTRSWMSGALRFGWRPVAGGTLAFHYYDGVDNGFRGWASATWWSVRLTGAAADLPADILVR